MKIWKNSLRASPLPTAEYLQLASGSIPRMPAARKSERLPITPLNGRVTWGSRDRPNGDPDFRLLLRHRVLKALVLCSSVLILDDFHEPPAVFVEQLDHVVPLDAVHVHRLWH